MSTETTDEGSEKPEPNKYPNRFQKGWKGGPGRPKGSKSKPKPFTGTLPGILEENYIPVVNFVKDKKKQIIGIEIVKVPLPEGMTYAKFLMTQRTLAAVDHDAAANRDIKEWVEGKTPEANPIADDDGTNEDAEHFEEPPSFPDEAPLPPTEGMGEGA